MSNQPCLDPLHDIESASVDELHSLQLPRMKTNLRHAYTNCPAYTSKFDDCGVHPDDLYALEDIAKSPFPTKLEQLTAADPLFPTQESEDTPRIEHGPTV